MNRAREKLRGLYVIIDPEVAGGRDELGVLRQPVATRQPVEDGLVFS